MERNLAYRGLFILLVVAAAAYFAFPPSEKINLGLDLQGGMHLVVQVNTDDAVGAETENTMDSLQRELEEIDINGSQAEQIDTTSFRVSGVPSDKVSEVRDDILEAYLPGWDMSRNGNDLIFNLSSFEESTIRQLSVNQARETIRSRVDAFGVAEPIIHDEGIGSDRIVVQLPGVDDPQRVKELIGRTAFLELRLVAQGTGASDTHQGAIDQLPAGLSSDLEVFEEVQRDQNRREIGTQYWVLEKRRVVTGRDLKNARMSSGEFGEPSVSFFLTRDGGDKFAEISGANIGRGLSIVLDNKVMSVATIRDRIRDQGVIHGNFTVQEVQDLVTVLRSGALPASLEFLEERTVGPTLGRDSIEKGRKAGLIGALLVVIAMLLVYKLTGINAVVALTLNVVLVFGVLATFGLTLTLPGIAGIVLTIGMAVDANVLIFERIREEIRSGRTVKSAITAGFAKALSSILDANITTLIASIFLFTFGTGPIRGFAVTLSVGIVASVFTAVFISRFIFDLLYAKKTRVDSLSI